uniref:Sleeping Beauty transposase HTH domain-containing protein n=1 Tax=Kryptolebias marmoratus TaxID=37003 RepID=A0A3Q3A0Z3_KRYMA
MPCRKYISNDLREADVAAHQSGEGFKTISKQFGVHYFTLRKILHKWKTLKTAASFLRSGCLSKFTPRSNCGQRNSRPHLKAVKGVGQ